MTTSVATNVFAACRVSGKLIVKRIPINPDLQTDLLNIFIRQETSFRNGVTEELKFDGGWKADSNQLLVIDLTAGVQELTAEVEILQSTVSANAISVETIDTNNFQGEGIKAIFIHHANKLLVQRFTSGQVLSRQFAYIFRGNSFRKMEDPAFTMSNSLTCIVEDEDLKFKSFSNLRSIFSLQEVYREATDEEVRDFAEHAKLQVEDIDGFLESSTQPMRKIISSIADSGILDEVSSQDIKNAAATTGLDINLQSGRIVLPQNNTEAMDVLRFLDEDRWSGLLSGTTYITNSKKRV